MKFLQLLPMFKLYHQVVTIAGKVVEVLFYVLFTSPNETHITDQLQRVYNSHSCEKRPHAAQVNDMDSGH